MSIMLPPHSYKPKGLLPDPRVRGQVLPGPGSPGPLQAPARPVSQRGLRTPAWREQVPVAPGGPELPDPDGPRATGHDGPCARARPPPEHPAVCWMQVPAVGPTPAWQLGVRAGWGPAFSCGYRGERVSVTGFGRPEPLRAGLTNSNVLKQKDREGFSQSAVRTRPRDTPVKPHGDGALAPWGADEVS